MTRIARPVLCVLVGALLVSDPSAAAPITAVDLREATAAHPELVALYEPRGFEPLWVARDGSWRPAARDAWRLLEHAADEGLDPADYREAAEFPARGEKGLPSQADLLRAEVALSRAMLRYLRHLHLGRVDPRPIGFALNVSHDGHDFGGLLGQAVDAGTLVFAARTLRPRDPQYAALAIDLAHYRMLASAGAAVPLPLPAAGRVRPGESYPAVATLWARLVALGDAPADAAAPSGGTYAGAVVEAVRRFQQRHGLDADGILGRKTFEALAVPMTWRVRQIELAMERLRWLPHQEPGRLIAVNIPMFLLSAWDTIPPVGRPGFTTGVIVGKALSTETPVFSATLNEIIFRPYWNVPRSIVRAEVLPALARDPAYLEKHDMELVTGESDQAPVVAATSDNIARLRAGQVRLRQRPGPKNSLGLIKFSFPNENDVYMHATPAQALFARSRRDFSHGCVRVEDPVGLAEWVLNDPAWDRAAITAAMDASVSSRASVRPGVRVMLLYTTAAKRFDTGELVFAPDIYGHDARLDAALRATTHRPGTGGW